MASAMERVVEQVHRPFVMCRWWLCSDIAGLTGYRLCGDGGLTGGTAVMGRFGMGGAVAVNRLITVRLGDAELEVGAVLVAAGTMLEAFSRAQDVIIDVANNCLCNP